MSGAAGATPCARSGPATFSPFVYGVSRGALLLWERLWLRLTIEGREHEPKTGPLLAVGNHCSYLDPPILGTALRRPVHFLAQQGLASFAPLRWWLAKAGVGLIDRKAPSKDVLRALANVLEVGGVVSVFPEGTRSPDGAVGPFRSGVEFLVRRTGATVLPVGIEGSFRAYPRGAWVPRPTKCRVRIGAPWTGEQVLAPGGIAALRREIARLAHAPLRDEPSAAQAPQSPPQSPAGPRSKEAAH